MTLTPKRSSLRRHLGALLTMVMGTSAVLWLVLEMNAHTPAPPKADAQTAVNIEAAPKRKVKPKKKKLRKRKARKTQRRAAPPAPQLGSALSGMDLGMPSLGNTGLDSMSQELLDEATRNKDLIMSESAVDQPPRPMKGNRPPKYPSRAARDGLTGMVVLKVLVGTDGSALKVRVVSASPPGVFDQAASEAVRAWRFEPAVYEGRAVKTWARLPLNFRAG